MSPWWRLAQDSLTDPAYLAQLKARAIAGTWPPAVETMLFHYRYGRPVERHEHTGDASPRILAVSLR